MVSIFVASDWAPIRALEPLALRPPEEAFGGLLPVMRGADFRIVNCECALTSASRPVWKSGAVFKGLPVHAVALASVPFDVACLANNHVFDYGLDGFRETLNVLHEKGIRTVGAGLDGRSARAPLVLKIKGERITILNFGEGEDLTAAGDGPGVCGWEIERLASLVRDRKKRGDFVLVIGHAGLEYVPFPPPYVVAAYRALSDAGADAVIGHHPHVPQGLEMRDGRLVAYSLGNFFFYQPAALFYRRTGFSLVLNVSGGGLVSHALHPHRITEEGLSTLGRSEERSFRAALAKVSMPLAGPGGPEEAWQSYLAYYGPEGFRSEVLDILDRMKSEPKKGAAMFRNRLTTLQHSELWREALTRFMAEKPAPVRAGHTRLIEEWFTKAAPAG